MIALSRASTRAANNADLRNWQWSCFVTVHKQVGTRYKVPKSVLRAVLGRMQFTFHATRRTPHGASRLVQAISAWLMKTRRTPSRQSRDARVYGHTNTAMHKLSTRRPPTKKPALFPPPLYDIQDINDKLTHSTDVRFRNGFYSFRAQID